MNRATRIILALALLCTLLLSGCVAVGPRSIQAGRVSYAEVINQTEDEQMLLAIVKGRYGDTATLLAVNAVAASMRFRMDAGVEVGFGGSHPGDNLGMGGLAYEENPTISYAPIQGEKYLRRLMAPLSLEDVALFVRSSAVSKRMMGLLIARVNGLRNPDFVRRADSMSGQRFAQFLELFSDLREEGIIEVLGNPNADVAFDVWIDNSRPAHAAEIDALLALLELPVPTNRPKTYVIPVFHAINRDNAWAIGISMRSTYDLIEIMRASVQVPQEHQSAGLALDYPPLGGLAQGIRIASSKSKPEGAAPAVRYRDYWYYINDTDHSTKAAFIITRLLWSVSIADSGDIRNAPLLTIPVSN